MIVASEIKQARQETKSLDSYYDWQTGFKLKNNSFHLYKRDEILEYLKQHPTLRSIDFSNNNLNDADIIAIASVLKLLRHLVYINFANNNIGLVGAEALATALANHHSIEALYLNNNNLGDEGCVAISTVVANNPIINLTLGNNKLTQKSLDVLAHVLEGKESLTSLELTSNRLSAGGFEKIGAVLARKTNITSLSLGGGNLGDKGAMVAAQIVANNPKITQFNFNLNRVGFEGTLAVIKALVNHTQLSLLAISDIYINAEIQTEILKVLRKNVNLFCLIISNNNSNNYNFLSGFSEWLATKPLLKQLYLGNNGITDSDVLMIAKQLAALPNLVDINFEGNNIQDEGALNIIKAISANPNKLEINLSKNRISRKGLTNLYNFLQEINSTRNFNITLHTASQISIEPEIHNIHSVDTLSEFLCQLRLEKPGSMSDELYNKLTGPNKKENVKKFFADGSFFKECTSETLNYMLKGSRQSGNSFVRILVNRLFSDLSPENFKQIAPKIQKDTWNSVLYGGSDPIYMRMLERDREILLLLQCENLIAMMEPACQQELKRVAMASTDRYIRIKCKQYFSSRTSESSSSFSSGEGKHEKVDDAKEVVKQAIAPDELEKIKQSLTVQSMLQQPEIKSKPATLDAQLKQYFPVDQSLLRWRASQQGNAHCLIFETDKPKTADDLLRILRPFLTVKPYVDSIKFKSPIHTKGKSSTFTLIAKETTLFNFFNNDKLIPLIDGKFPLVVPTAAAVSNQAGNKSNQSQESASLAVTDVRQPLKALSLEEQANWEKNIRAFFCDAEQLSLIWLDQEISGREGEQACFIMLLPARQLVWTVRDYKSKERDRHYFHPSLEFVLDKMLLRAKSQFEQVKEAKFVWDSNCSLDHQFIKIFIYEKASQLFVDKHHKNIYLQLQSQYAEVPAPAARIEELIDFNEIDALLNSDSDLDLDLDNSDNEDEVEYFSDADDDELATDVSNQLFIGGETDNTDGNKEDNSLTDLDLLVDSTTQEANDPVAYLRVLCQKISVLHFSDNQPFLFLAAKKLDKGGKWDLSFNYLGTPHLQSARGLINPRLLLEAICESMKVYGLPRCMKIYEKNDVHLTFKAALIPEIHKALHDNPQLIFHLQRTCRRYDLSKSENHLRLFYDIPEVSAKDLSAKPAHKTSYKRYIGRAQTELQTKRLIHTIRNIRGIREQNFHYHMQRLQAIPAPALTSPQTEDVFFYSYLAHTMRVCSLLSSQFFSFFPSTKYVNARQQNTYNRLRNAIRHAANELNWEQFHAATHPFLMALLALQEELPSSSSGLTLFDYIPSETLISPQSVEKLQGLIQQFAARLDTDTLGDGAPEKNYLPTLLNIQSVDSSDYKKDRRDALIMVHALQHKETEKDSQDSKISRSFGHYGFDKNYEGFANQLYKLHVVSQDEEKMQTAHAPKTKR